MKRFEKGGKLKSLHGKLFANFGHNLRVTGTFDIDTGNKTLFQCPMGDVSNGLESYIGINY